MVEHYPLSRDEVLLQRMEDFHRQRVEAVETGNVPLDKQKGGFLIVHLIPECCVVDRKRLSGATLKEHGARITPLGNHGGNNRFNVDGFLNRSGYDEVKAYSQLFRDGRLESVMSEAAYPVDRQFADGGYAIRCEVIERSILDGRAHV